ncbi:MAG: Rieske 2Fe-2S domain-containing protein [Dehalococcoidia bacterium]
MISPSDNEILTRTGKGTPLGEVMRRYWLPALLSTELPEPDSPPVRVKLLGEDLVAFRDTLGRVGVLEEHCPHRLASLFLGRNEECGLRCVYHGWKFDVEGACLDMMNEPPGSDFHNKVRARAYPTLEQGGVVWAYLGAPEQRPAPPNFEWTRVAATHRHVSKNSQETNWLQGPEGGIDSAHAPILHRTISTETSLPGIGINTDFVTGGASALEVDVTDYGYQYVGVRDLKEQGTFARGYQYVLPFHQMRPRQRGYKGQPDETVIAGHMWVPLDDENCMVYNWAYSYGEKAVTDEQWLEMERGYGRGPEHLLPNFQTIGNRDNDWRIDRRVQKTETFTGIEGINAQDVAVQESMGNIVDRDRENLARSDMAIVSARRLLLQAARTVADGGDPPGLAPTYYNARAIEHVLPPGVTWREGLLPEMHPE